MLYKKEQMHRDEFINLLKELSKPQDVVETEEEKRAWIEKIRCVYQIGKGKTPIRHYYSDIFFVLRELAKDTSSAGVSTLEQNLEYLYRWYNQDEVVGWDEQTARCLSKIYDYVKLDASRMDYSDENDKKIADLYGSRERLEKGMSEMGTNFEKINDKLSSAQTESIAILSIFSAVVIAFMGGISFANSVFTANPDISIYRLVMTVLLVGLVLLGVLFSLFSFIKGIVSKGERLRIYPAIIVGIVILALMVLTVFAWRNDWLGEGTNIKENHIISDELIE